MKLTNKNGKYNLELNEFELQCLFLVTGNSSGQGKISDFLYNLYENICDIIDTKDFSWTIEYYNFLTKQSNFDAKIVVDDNLNKNSFDLVQKQDCSFYYPKAGRRDSQTFDIRYLEQRTLKDSYEKDGYLMGFDNGTLKKFKMGLIVNLKYSE
jgi:hypothetical protein